MEQEAFCQIIKQYQQSLLVIAFNYCRNRADAEDVVQDVFLRLYRKPPELADADYLKNWLIRVTINRNKDYLRSPFRKHRAPEEAAQAIIAAPEEHDCVVFDAVMSLPQKYREVVVLYYYHEYSTAEIASLLSRKLTTVQTQLMRAREQLRGILKEEGNNESDSTQFSDAATVRGL